MHKHVTRANRGMHMRQRKLCVLVLCFTDLSER